MLNFTHLKPGMFSRIWIVALALLATLQPGVAAAVDGASSQIYLPLVNKSNSAPGATTTPNPTTTPGGQPDQNMQPAMFVDSGWKTSSAIVRIDATGGQHVAYTYYEPKIEQRPDAAVYTYCPSQCDKPASWQSVRLLADKNVNEVQMQLDPAGKPRLLIRTASTVYQPGNDYYYATCDENCTTANGWTLTLVRSYDGKFLSELQDDELPQRSFALDPQGHPRFVYNDSSNGNYGVFYAFCDSNCNDRNAWQQTRINRVQQNPYRDDNINHPVLTFTSDGRPRLVTAEFAPMDDGDASLAYYECNDACDQTASWQFVTLMPRGGGAEPSADIALDSQDRPRIAFYQEAGLNNQGKQLFYLWCNTDCLNAANWQQRNLGLGTWNGQEPDLALDGAGRPRIAYANNEGGGVGYAWCNEACDTANAQWDHKILENGDTLYKVWPVAYPPHCDGGIWNSVAPTLAFWPTGNPLIAYDATYWARCWYDDKTDTYPPDSVMHLIKRAVRVLPFAQPFTLPPDPATPTGTRTPTATRTPTPAATPTPPATPFPTPVRVVLNQTTALFADTQARTSSASVAVDNNGGKHMAFYYAAGQTPGAPSNAVYRYCASNCDNSLNWQSVSLAEKVNEVQLELDPAGKPHLLIRTQSATDPEGYAYLYAVCTGNCTSNGGWVIVPLVSSHGGASQEQHDAEQPQRSFELDPSGRPRFVYLDDNRSVDPLHVGVFYVWCDENCTENTQWQEVLITDLEQWDGQIDKQERALYLALAFTPDGKPRLITAAYYPYLTTTDTQWSLGYFACDEMCDLGYLWTGVDLTVSGDGPLPSADLAIDAAGHPHVAFYQEKTSGILPDGSQTPARQNLWYLSCQETNCLNRRNWQTTHLGIDGLDGGAPDLALDTQGRPRIAYALGETGGLGYAWCNADCLAGSEHWQHGLIESRAQLQTAWPQTHPATCDAGGWTGWTPTLVLPTTGDPMVAYDAVYVAHCFYDDNPNDAAPATWHDDVLQRAARLVSFTQP